MKHEGLEVIPSGKSVYDTVAYLARERSDALAENASLRAEITAVKATQAKVTSDYAACFAENERLRALLASWLEEDCEFDRVDTSEWYCNVHKLLMIAPHEPVNCAAVLAGRDSE